MLSLERSSSFYVIIRATGVLGSSDYDRFETKFSDELRHWTVPVPLLLDMRAFRGWTPSGLLRDLLWDLRNRKTFSKIAALGDATWHQWITHAGAPLFTAEIRFFGEDEEAAKGWLRRVD